MAYWSAVLVALIAISTCGWVVYLLWSAFFCPSCDEDVRSVTKTARLRHPDDTFTPDEHRYWREVEDLAARLTTDGCTGVINVHVRCCDRHDIDMILRYDAFVVVPEEERDPARGYTAEGHPFLSKAEADRRFLNCMRRHSRLGFWSPVAYIRYRFVRWFGNGGHEWGNGPKTDGSF